jgi:competence protein ComEC
MFYEIMPFIKRLASNFVHSFFEERSRWILWWPVGMSLGIALYFCLKFEPTLPQALIPFFIALLTVFSTAFRQHQNPALFLISLSLLSATLGFTAAKIRTHCLVTPMLTMKLENRQLTARIIDIEEHPNRRRLILDDLRFAIKAPRLHKIRLNLPITEDFHATIGDQISLTADLLPLSDPVSLTGYNFRRQAFFQGISAVGRVKGHVRVTQKSDRFFGINKARHHLTKTIRQYLPGQTGEVAAALITGDRSGIHPNIRQAFADAGIAHILAISGLHLSLVAGLVFLFFRRGLSLIPYLAENYAIKKGSAGTVIAATLAYLALSGFGIPAQRAFIMISIVMIGIMLDRNPLSMRLVAIAGTVVLLLRPESLLSVSFQLSFAAVIALIAAYEGGWSPLRAWSLEGGAHRRIMAYSLGLIVTTLIATLATTPYTIATFNRFTLQTIVGNFLAIPLTSLLIMPAAMVSVISLIFGGIDSAFALLNFGLSYLIHIAEMVSAWPGAAIMIATPPPAFITFITLGGLWICFWQKPWRWVGLIPCIFGCLIPLFHHPADIFIAGDGTVMAYRKGDALYVSEEKRGTFFTDQWMRESGLTQKKVWPKDPIQLESTWLIHNLHPSYKSLKHACSAEILLSTTYIWRKCHRIGIVPQTLIDRHSLYYQGTHQLRITSGGVKIESVRASLGKRPWNYGSIPKG